MKLAQPFRHRSVSFAATLAIALGITLSAAGPAAAEQGICKVTAGTSSGHKYAAMKCAKKSNPDNFFISSSVWERKNKKAYANLARLAGRSFTCTLKRVGTVTRPSVRTITYDISNCR
ncbi:hypothetical protein [Bauldia sp.]|uniref:hypothetical protein n=1 Tax=Bauldia sp. TaxID=2575872 RepID=UPI003BA91626